MSIESLVARPGSHPLDRLEQALGAELATKLVFALARSRPGAPLREAAA